MTLRLGLLLASLTLAWTPAPTWAEHDSHAATDRFSDHSLLGTWVLEIQGAAIEGNALGLDPGAQLFAVAIVRFDGRGVCKSIDHIEADGISIPAPGALFREATACTYFVNANGTGQFDVEFEGSGVTNATFVITNRRQASFTANNDTLGIFGGGTMTRR